MLFCAKGDIAAAGTMASCNANGLIRANLVSKPRASFASMTGASAPVIISVTLQA
jgi:hypothetical protein